VDSKKKILFVEDDNEYRKAITDILTKENYSVFDFETPIEAIEFLVDDQECDLIISDFSMDQMNGMRLLKYVKKTNPHIRTIMLTGMPNEEIKNEAEVFGVDKYLGKDVRIDVFLHYVDYFISLPKLMDNNDKAKLEDLKEGVVINLRTRAVTKDEKEIKLTYKEFGLLKLLLERKGEAVSRQEIIEELWDVRYEEIDTRVIDVHMTSIRNKLRLQSIISIRGFGYKWEE
jgi:Response regulators consisting of a CheY-like receiver domain and a winged-helix DNA-binding domain